LIILSLKNIIKSYDLKIHLRSIFPWDFLSVLFDSWSSQDLVDLSLIVYSGLVDFWFYLRFQYNASYQIISSTGFNPRSSQDSFSFDSLALYLSIDSRAINELISQWLPSLNISLNSWSSQQFFSHSFGGENLSLYSWFSDGYLSSYILLSNLSLSLYSCLHSWPS